MSPKRITDAWGLDDVSQWARDALEYSYQPEFRRQLKVVVRKLGRKHGALLGPVGLVGVTITSGLWELLDKFAPRGERCGVREQNVLEIATVGVLLDQHRTLAAAAQLAPSEPTPRRELDERVNGWRVGWHNAVTAAQSAVESGDATAAQQRIVELVRRALESRVGADKSDAARLIDAMFRPDAPVDPEAVSQREKLADVSTSLFLAQREKPARLANALFRKKDGRFTLSELGFRDVVVKRRRTKLTRIDVEDDLEELAVDKSATPVDAASQAEEARLAVEVRNTIDAFRAEAHAKSSVSPVRRVVADNARALLQGEISARALAEKHELSRQAIDLEFSKLKKRILKGIGPKEL